MSVRCGQEGLNTKPWGAPLLSINIEEVWLPVWTLWGLLVRNSNIQLQIVVLQLWFSNQCHCVEVNKHYPDVAVLIIHVCEDWVKGSRYVILAYWSGSRLGDYYYLLTTHSDDDGKLSQVLRSTKHFWSFTAHRCLRILLNNWSSQGLVYKLFSKNYRNITFNTSFQTACLV